MGLTYSATSIQTPTEEPEAAKLARESKAASAASAANAHNAYRANVSKVAFLTSVFNAPDSKSRRDNFVKFRDDLKRHGVDLWIVEGVFPGRSPEYEGANVFHVPCESVIWQKERLLNIAAERLPDEYDAVAWVDADILWPACNLRDRTLTALRGHKVIQLWETAEFLNRDGVPIPWYKGNKTAPGMAARNVHMKPIDASPAKSHPGFAWAARREVFSKLDGIYDLDISGGGDSTHAIGWYGDLGSSYLTAHNAEMRMSTLEWAYRAFHLVNRSVGFLQVRIQHLYHGTRENRHYWDRINAVSELGYNPLIDLEPDRRSALKWSKYAKPELVSWLQEFLLTGRKEDE